MSIATQLAPALLEVMPSSIRRFTVEEYLHIIRAGVFADGERLELLEGYIVPKMPRNPPHDATIELVQDALQGRLPAGFRVRVQCGALGLDSVPEPDLAVVRGDIRARGARHPGPPDIALVVEVSDSSLAQDRGIKRRLYARAGFAAYWIVNLVDSRVEAHSDPTGPAPDPTFRLREEFGSDAAVPLVIDGVEVARIAVRELLL